ncbi:MAG: hypothetical protein AB7P40_19815 [Chloroflexota bacterium]
MDTRFRQWLGLTMQAILAAVLLTSLFVFVQGSVADAAPVAVEPRQIALTPEDMPPGFTVAPDHTREGVIANVGPMYQIGMTREFTEQNMLDGPVFVLQQVVRLESSLGAGDALTLQRNYWTAQAGYIPSPSGPNDGGTFSLEKTDQGVKTYMLGFIKENMIIITGLGGVDGVVTYEGVKELAGISSGRMDAALAQ